MRLMFESFPRENLEKIARMLGEGAAHEELLFLFQRITPGTILQFIELWPATSTPTTVNTRPESIFSQSNTM